MRPSIKPSIWVWIIAMAMAVVACTAQGSSLRSDSQDIRQRFVLKNPLGSSFDDVLRDVKAQGYTPVVSKNAGFLRQEKGQPVTVVGVSSMKANIGDYWTFPFLTTTVTAFWGFDSNGKLIDVWIWKTTDAP